jgi:5-methylcytosine-specific restriction endonuclease McrA
VHTDGFYAELGKGKGYKLALWFDRYIKWGKKGEHILSVGVQFYGKKGQERYAEVRKKLFPKAQVIKNDDQVPIDNSELIQLRRPLAKHNFHQEILEDYGLNKQFVSIYLGKIHDERVPKIELVDLIEGLLADISKVDVSKKVAFLRTRISLHERYERDPAQANEAKRRAKYICQVCKFHYPRKYGGIGQGYLEAHHKVPLAQLKKRAIIYTKDLLGVCADCHRMLHLRLAEAPDKNAVAWLRAQVINNKKFFRKRKDE